MKYIGDFKARLEDDHGKRITSLIWGDPVHVLEDHGDWVSVRARTHEGRVRSDALSDNGLLELYIIDVGQGDSVLMRTPNDRWHLVDAGVANRNQMTKKGAANFLRWKFIEDLEGDTVSLQNLIVTHPDYDHYGGCLDLLTGQLFDGRTFDIEVGNFYHCGMARFSGAPSLGERVSGEVDDFPEGYHGIRQRGSFIRELIESKADFSSPPRSFTGDFSEFASLIGSVPNQVRALSHRETHLPGYAPGDNADLSIRVLGPILEEYAPGQRGLRWLSSQSVTRNGHSIVLRIDYGAARILLTGDLNTKSQRLLLSYHSEDEFASDVAKGCHHGAEDVHLDFIQAIKARATIISSGDNEDYAHPRPMLLGASGLFGRRAVSVDGEMLPPLLYSTELSRAVKLARAARARVDVDRDPETSSKRFAPHEVEIDPYGSVGYRRLDRLPVSTDLVYGLVNVRTDGEHILLGTMEERGTDFDIKVIRAGVDPEE